MTTDSEHITPLLAGMDTVYFSCDLPLSDAMRERLTQEKTVAQAHAAQRQVYCPEWLEACIAPQGAKGGYAFLVEAEDLSVKLLVAGWSGVIHWERKLVGLLERSSSDAPTTEADPTDHGGD